jgi:Flp pilus assembly protein TadG
MCRPADRRFQRDERGAVAAEFAMVIGFAVAAVLSVINGGLMFYSYSNLHMAVESTARWASIRTTVDGAEPDTTAVQAKGEDFYVGATDAPSFTATAASCGIQVTASATFTLMLGIGSTPVSMTATACHPLG